MGTLLPAWQQLGGSGGLLLPGRSCPRLWKSPSWLICKAKRAWVSHLPHPLCSCGPQRWVQPFLPTRSLICPSSRSALCTLAVLLPACSASSPFPGQFFCTCFLLMELGKGVLRCWLNPGGEAGAVPGSKCKHLSAQKSCSTGGRLQRFALVGL